MIKCWKISRSVPKLPPLQYPLIYILQEIIMLRIYEFKNFMADIYLKIFLDSVGLKVILNKQTGKAK